MLSKRSRYLLFGTVVLVVAVIIGVVIWKHHSGSGSGSPPSPPVVCSGNGNMSCNCVPPFVGADCSTGLTGKYYITFYGQPAATKYLIYNPKRGWNQTYWSSKTPVNPGDPTPMVVSLENSPNNNLVIAYYGTGKDPKKYLAPKLISPTDMGSTYLPGQIANAVASPQNASEFNLISIKNGYYLQYLGRGFSSILGHLGSDDDVDFFQPGVSSFDMVVVVFEPVS